MIMDRVAGNSATLRGMIAAGAVSFAVLGGCADALAQVPAYYNLHMDAVGCGERQEFLDAMKLSSDAFAKLMVRKAAAGECRVFLKDDVVSLDQADLTGALSCLRPRGNARCYWTFRAVIN